MKKLVHKLPYTLLLLLFFLVNATITEAQIRNNLEVRNEKLRSFREGKPEFGIGINLYIELLEKSRAYYRVSITGGVGMSVYDNDDKNIPGFALFSTTELDIFRGGLGANSLSFQDQKILSEFRQSFMGSCGWSDDRNMYSYVRPMVHFVSNSSYPLLSPYSYSLSLGTTFVNSLQVPRAQRVGLLNVGIGKVSFTYLNDGPFFHKWYLPLGDGFDQWWTGSGQLGVYQLNKPDVQQIEIKYDKFTGLQPYAYEIATALKMKNIPYRDSAVANLNRNRLGINVLFKNHIGITGSLYDKPALDLQNSIHFRRLFAYHSTPLKPEYSIGVSYTRTYLMP